MKNIRVTQKRRPRVEISLIQRNEWETEPPPSAAKIVLTKQGIEITGWYDSFVGLGESGFISWEEFEKCKEMLKPLNYAQKYLKNIGVEI